MEKRGIRWSWGVVGSRDRPPLVSLKSYLEVHYTICEASSLFSRQLKHGDMEDMTKSSRRMTLRCLISVHSLIRI